MFSKIGFKKTLTQLIEEELTKAIRTGKYLPGQKIPTENELCAIFNVSRTVIREAVKILSARGIVDVRKGSGVYVSEMSIHNASETLNIFFELSSDKDLVLQTIETRLLIEPVLAAVAAKNRNEKHLDLLKKNMNDMRLCALEDKKREAELDNDFHSEILSISNNKVMKLLLNPIFHLMPRFKTVVFAKHGGGNIERDKEKMLDHHQNILQAIIEKDEVKATQSMRNHIEETRKNYLKSNLQ